MEPRIHVITLAVDDLDRSLRFYRALGFHSTGVIGAEFVGDDTHPGGSAAMFELQNGLLLMLYGRSDLAKDAGLPLEHAGSIQFSIGHLVSRREDVDAVLAQARAAGATLPDQPHERPWGIYSGYFRDPDGYLWEVIWNPQMPPTP